jgi:CRISPR system Cascade subunit CasA
MPYHNLLTEKLISVRYENGAKDNLTLPGILGRLSQEDIESFAALQPHQEQAWYCFLVQLAAMAMHESGREKIEGDENEWAGRLRTLTKDYPKDEPWCMVVEDLSKPAFMQTPVPEGDLISYKNKVTIPDEIDTLILAKDHDVKAQRAYALT